jgi:hypothetical protein
MIPTAVTADAKVAGGTVCGTQHPGSRRAVMPDEQVRANYFVARHQWLEVKKHWTCLAADRPHGWTAHDFTDFLKNHNWRFARTMPDNPHFYTLRRHALHSVFDDAVRYMRDKGVIEYFSGKPYKMLHHGDHKFWTMGAPLSATALINRKDIDPLEVLQPPVGALPFFPFLPSCVEALPRADCLDTDGKALDIDDFEFFVELVRESGNRVLGHYYLELDGYLYWTRGLPEKAQAVHRARRPVGSSA